MSDNNFKQNKKHIIYPYYYKNKFYNNKYEPRRVFLISNIKMVIEWYLCRKYYKKIDTKQWIEKSQIIERSENLNITWIGHSTFLIQINNINILTDPIFNDISIFFKRLVPAGIELDKLPKIDYVILSHNHFDHMNNYTLDYIKKYNNPNVRYLVPLNDKNWFIKKGFNKNNVYEFMWWQDIEFNNIKFIFLPANHWSQRGLFDYNKSLWGSWLINLKNNNINLYFAGDTSYDNHFKYISYEFNSIDLAIMPIGPCEPNKWLKKSHINAEEAVQAFIDLKAKNFIPMHWGTYYFGIDNYFLPYNRLIACWEKQNFSKEKLYTFKIGQRREINLVNKSVSKKLNNLSGQAQIL